MCSSTVTDDIVILLLVRDRKESKMIALVYKTLAIALVIVLAGSSRYRSTNLILHGREI